MEYYLYHHGILGQRWGKRNGPPYPLDSKEHSASERKAGWRRSLDKGSDETYNKDRNKSEKKHLSEGQKRAIKIGIAAAASALAAYGTYKLVKSGKLDNVINAGKEKLNSLFKTEVEHKRFGEFLSGDADDILGKEKRRFSSVFKKLTKCESISDVINNTNPLRGTKYGRNNCSACGIAAFLRTIGYDVKAKGTNGQKQNLGGILEECFKGVKVLDGSATKFGKSRDDAAEMLVKRFGQNADGVCNIQWKGKSDGHVFNWSIRNGIVTFFDAQNGLPDEVVSKQFWGNIDPYGFLQLARLDNTEINFDAIQKYVG